MPARQLDLRARAAQTAASSPAPSPTMLPVVPLLRRCLLLSACLLGASGCVFGPLRQARVDALGAHGEVRAASVTVAPGAPPATSPALADAVRAQLQGRAQLAPAAAGDATAFRVELTAQEVPLAEGERAMAELLARAANQPPPRASLAVEGRLYAPGDQEPRGLVRWLQAGEPGVLAGPAGEAVGGALAEGIHAERRHFFDRRASDERRFLSPTATVMPAGAFSVSDDEVLMLRAAFGLGSRVQLDVWLGGLPIPLSGATALPLGHAVGAMAGVGVGVIGAFDVGLKFQLLEESAQVPGVTLSYDMLDGFGALFGGGAGFLLGNGVLIAAAPGVAAANVQLNVFALTVGKHFGNTDVNVGTYVIDNHNFLPQSAGFAVGVVSNGGVADTSASTPLPHLPTVVQPYLNLEQVLGPHSALALEVFPRWPASASFGTTGVRWQLGFDEPHGVWALDRVRVRLDAALVWLYAPASDVRPQGTVLPLPWLGLSVYVR